MNTFGRLFRVHIFGESHGQSIGCSIDGCPPGIALPDDDFMGDLQRRRPGKRGTTARRESDTPAIVSGVFNGHTTGAPITIMFENTDARSTDYSVNQDIPRPGHADLVARQRFKGYNDYRGGGHFSGRLTLALVAAGVVAKKILSGVHIHAELTEAGGQKDIDRAIEQALQENDSIGGIVECRAINVPGGLGEPFFDSTESLISHLAFAVPAIKGIAFGSGFSAAKMKGSEHNDPITDASGITGTNNAGGISGGLTNGNELVFRVAVKPPSSIGKPQKSVNLQTNKIEELQAKGRHDACIALRVPVVIEAITAIALADLLLLAQGQGYQPGQKTIWCPTCFGRPKS